MGPAAETAEGWMMPDELLDYLGDLFIKGRYQKRFGITFLQFLEACTSQGTYYRSAWRTLFQQWLGRERG